METATIKKPNYFVRVLIVFFCLGLSIMIGYSFFCVPPAGVIKGGLFVLLGMLLILVLAESFDNFSLGKLISINREYVNKKEENKVLEKRNTELINQLITISNSQNQRQQTTTVFGDLINESRKNIQHDKSDNNNVKELLDRIGNSNVISDHEKRIKEELKGKDFEIAGPTAEVLIRHLAGTQVILEFERIYYDIFGSQIQLLKELNRLKPDGLTEPEVFSRYDQVKQLYPTAYANWDGVQYLAFLYAKTLILKSADNKIHLTVIGEEFLTWITRNGRAENKGL